MREIKSSKKGKGTFSQKLKSAEAQKDKPVHAEEKTNTNSAKITQRN